MKVIGLKGPTKQVMTLNWPASTNHHVNELDLGKDMHACTHQGMAEL